MATKKDIKEKKIVKPIIKEPVKPKKEEVEEEEFVEQTFFAKELADQMAIDNFDFLLIKREMGLEDNSIMTMAEMQKLYNKIIGR